MLHYKLDNLSTTIMDTFHVYPGLCNVYTLLCICYSNFFISIQTRHLVRTINRSINYTIIIILWTM